MRLIDADKLEPDIEWSKFYDEFMAYSQRQIRNAEEIKAIRLDKIEQAREKIKRKAFTEEIFDEDIFKSTNTESVSRETAECESYIDTEVVKMSDVLEILDNLIAESEE